MLSAAMRGHCVLDVYWTQLVSESSKARPYCRSRGAPGSTPHPVYARYEAVDGEDGEQPDYVIPPPVAAAGLVAYQDADIVAHVANAAGPRCGGLPQVQVDCRCWL